MKQSSLPVQEAKAVVSARTETASTRDSQRRLVRARNGGRQAMSRAACSAPNKGSGQPGQAGGQAPEVHLFAVCRTFIGARGLGARRAGRARGAGVPGLCWARRHVGRQGRSAHPPPARPPSSPQPAPSPPRARQPFATDASFASFHSAEMRECALHPFLRRAALRGAAAAGGPGGPEPDPCITSLIPKNVSMFILYLLFSERAPLLPSFGILSRRASPATPSCCLLCLLVVW